MMRSHALLALTLAVGCGSSTSTPASDGGPSAPSCDDYCATIMSDCTGADAQYSSMADCLSSCAAFPVGASDDTAGNTLGCRTYHAGAVASMGTTHCAHAGPGGDGVCGDDCEGFCTIALEACPAAYASLSECMTECAGFPDDVPYTTAATGGDSLACRLYHLTVATNAPDPHCGHVVEASDTCL